MLSRPFGPLAAVFALTACGDPAGGRASGNIVVSSAAAASPFVRLELRSCAADAGVGPTCVGSESAPLQRSTLAFDGGTSVSYALRVYPGFTTPVKDWRLVAWLSRSADAGDAPAPGEWWGTATVALPEYNGAGYYAGLGMADVTIDQQAP